MNALALWVELPFDVLLSLFLICFDKHNNQNTNTINNNNEITRICTYKKESRLQF